MDVGFLRRLVEVMVGSDDFHASRMCAVDDLGYNRVAGKDLYVNEINIAGLSCLMFSFA